MVKFTKIETFKYKLCYAIIMKSIEEIQQISDDGLKLTNDLLAMLDKADTKEDLEKIQEKGLQEGMRLKQRLV